MADQHFLTGRTAGMLVTALGGNLREQAKSGQWGPEERIALLTCMIQLGFLCGRVAELLEKGGAKVMVDDCLLSPGALPAGYAEEMNIALKALDDDDTKGSHGPEER